MLEVEGEEKVGFEVGVEIGVGFGVSSSLVHRGLAPLSSRTSYSRQVWAWRRSALSCTTLELSSARKVSQPLRPCRYSAGLVG